MASIEITNELYKSCRGTIEKACRTAYRDAPMVDLDDYRSYANEVFMDAALSYDPNSGVKFNTWLTTQLLRLKKYVHRGGRMKSDSGYTAESIVGSLDARIVDGNGNQSSLHDVRNPFNDSYLSSLSEPSWNYDWWQRMYALRPFMGELSDDAKVMVDDILDGNVSKKDSNGSPRPEHGNRMYARLSPRQLYIRVYAHRGWEFERVRCARIEIEEMLRKLPHFKLPEMEDEFRLCNISVRTIRDGVTVSKSSVAYDRFENSVKERKPEKVEEIHV